MGSNANEMVTVENNDDARLDEVVNNSVLIPLKLYDLNKVKNNRWITDQVIDSVIFKDLINGQDDIIAVSALCFGNTMFDYWGPEAKQNRLITIPRYNPNFTKAIIPVNFNNLHWSLAILDKPTKTCTFYCTLRYDIFDEDNAPQLTKLKLICRLLLKNEEADIVVAPTNSFLRQRDGYNCGPFIVILAKRILENGSLFFGKPEADAWRKNVYDFYIDYVPVENTEESTDPDDIKVIEEKVKKEEKKQEIFVDINGNNVVLKKNIKKEKVYDDEFVESKKVIKRTLQDDKNDQEIKKVKTDDKVGNAMETDKNNNVETMEVDEKLLSAAEEAQAQKEKNETFLEYCKRKHINKKAPKSRNAYNQSVTSADKILCENNRIKECMQKKRAFFEQKCETNEITKIAKLSTSQRVLKKARRKNADAKAEKRENETEKEKEERLQRDAESKQIKRESETVEEKQQRLNDDKNEKAIKRTINIIEKQEKLKNERAERLKNAKTKSSFTPQKAANYKGVKPFRLGKRDLICNGWWAKHYRAEKRQKDGTFTNCCQQGKVKMQVGVFDYPQLFKDLMTKKHENREYATTRIIWINQQVAYFIC